MASPTSSRRHYEEARDHKDRDDAALLTRQAIGAQKERQGSGKGTHQSRLKQRYDLRAVNAGDLLRETIRSGSTLGHKIKKIISTGALVEDEDVAKVIEPEIRKLKGNPWIIDGFPRKASQAKILDTMLQPAGEALNLVIFIDVPDEVILDRIENRWVHAPSGRTYNLTYNPPREPGKDDVTGEPLGKREDDNVEVFANRLKGFHAENRPLLEYYADQDAKRSPESSPKLLTFRGETSDIIFPQIHEAFKRRFPRTPTATDETTS